MRLLLWVAAMLVALTLSPSLFAGTASVSGSSVSYVAAAGEANRVIAASDPAGVRIVDLGAPVVAGAGCTAVSGNEVLCGIGFLFNATVVVGVGDLNDFVLVSGLFSRVIERGGDGNDVLRNGSPADSFLIGAVGDDTLDGSQALDRLRGGLGDDLLRGRGGSDTADYSERTAAVRVDLDGVAGDGEAGEADTLTGIEEIAGGAGDDRLAGNGQDNFIVGGAGDDTINGLGGFDILRDGLGDDTLNGGVRGDLMGGGQGDDTVNGGVGEDSMRGGTGADTLNGGAGSDDLGGDVGSDIVDGGRGDDFFVGGGPGADTVRAGPGLDQIDGGPGPDTLFARDGRRDRVRGGPGVDRAHVDRRLDTVTLIESFF
jgi:Ca2+-binding RTX toxin-like protein